LAFDALRSAHLSSGALPRLEVVEERTPIATVVAHERATYRPPTFRTMKLGLGLDIWASAGLQMPVEEVREAERLGFDSVWTAEAYGADAISPLAFLAARTSRIRLGTAIVQISARTATATAMAMATVDALAGGGRVICGLGLSGPQVVEGWYGQPWVRPVARMHDYVEILRKVWRRDGPMVHDGSAISVPYAGDDATAMAKPLRSILHTTDMPVWIAAGGPRMVELTAEIADGWIPMGFRPGMLDSHYRRELDAGFARRASGVAPVDFEIAPSVSVVVTDDLRATFAAMKPRTSMYVGGMGHPELNFHNQSMARVGYPDAAAKIQELFLAGRRDEAAAAVPDDFLDDGGLFGSEKRIRDRYAAWESSGATTLIVRSNQARARELLADLAGTREA
jgi:F420-dependent oxidoreductase-like protein